MSNYKYIGRLRTLKTLRALKKGNLDQLVALGENAEMSFLKIGTKPFLLPASSDLLEKFCFLDQKQTVKTPKAQFYLKKAIGRGLVSTDKEEWLNERRKVKGIFNGEELLELIKNAPSLINKKLHGSNEAIDAKELFSCVSIEVIGNMFFGNLSQEDQKEITRGINELISPTFWKIASPLPFLVDPLNKVTNRARNKIFKIIADNIDKARCSPGTNLTKKYFPLGNQTESIANLVIAGYETTANTLTWLFYELGQNENILRELTDELEKLDSYNDFSDLKSQIPFATACVNEALRLYPPIWIMSRTTTNQVQIEDLVIDEKTDILISPYLFHRMNKYWDNPNEFNPKRFEKIKTDPPYFFPFGKGVRACIGENVARIEIYLVLLVLIKNYTFTSCSKYIKPSANFSLVPNKPILINLKKYHNEKR